jgi:hypothetical protein
MSRMAEKALDLMQDVYTYEGPTTPKVYESIAAVMAKLAATGIGKNNNNTQQGYKFRGIDDVYNALAPLLSAEKLLILPRVLSRMVTERATQKGGVLFYVVLDVEFDLVSGIDGSKHTIRVCGEAMDSGDKATNKAMSAAYKYACMEAFCIPTEGDNDADATTHEVKSQAQVIADKFLEALKADEIGTTEEEAQAAKAARIMEIRESIGADNELLMAIWALLSAPHRRAIKTYINNAKGVKEAA